MSLPLLAPLKVGQVQVWPPVILAPMAGESGSPFRILCRRMGAGLVCTELTSSHGLHYRNARSLEYLRWTSEEHPISAQLFGAEPEIMRDAAEIVSAAGPDLIDINMGCWVPKVARTGAGAALLRDLPRAVKVMEAVVRGSSVPVTIKTRTGWDGCGAGCLDLAKAAQDAGVAAVAIHGRTAQQGFSGEADWRPIARAVEALQVPVIGNGDIRTPADAARMLRETGCAAVMVGRAALGNPWIFREINALLLNAEPPLPPTTWERLEMARQHARLLCMQRTADPQATTPIPVIARSQLAHYLYGLRSATEARRRLTRVETLGDVEAVLADLAAGALLDAPNAASGIHTIAAECTPAGAVRD